MKPYLKAEEIRKEIRKEIREQLPVIDEEIFREHYCSECMYYAEVSTEDRLSDHVQHYDSKEAVIENAEKRISRLEKEKAETKAAKKSIHDRLGEKKQQSAAKKAVVSGSKFAE